jgi:hypothetical protein
MASLFDLISVPMTSCFFIRGVIDIGAYSQRIESHFRLQSALSVQSPNEPVPCAVKVAMPGTVGVVDDPEPKRRSLP